VPVGIDEGLRYILDHYSDTKPGAAWGAAHPTRRVFSEIADALATSHPVASRPSLKVDLSGRGRQATLPWIAFLDKRETTTTQDGVYCAYLFREDLTGVYLCLTGGVTALHRRASADHSAFQHFQFYERDSIPDEESLLEDLQIMLSAYDQYIMMKFGSPPPVPEPEFDRVMAAARLIKQVEAS
jgi:hypothetical protein